MPLRSVCSPSCTGGCRCVPTAGHEAWTEDQFNAAHERLRAHGLVDDTSFTDAGRATREDIELHTDTQMAPAIGALGDDVDELLAIMTPWGETIRDGCGYLRAGPHDLARGAQGQ